MTDSSAPTRPSLAPPAGRARLRAARILATLGPGLMVSVGYIDPGNWATGIAAGSGYGMSLLWVVLASSAAGMLLQTLAAKLGVATGMDLAQVCRARYSRRTAIGLWLLCEVAICACDLAELLGAAIALKLLFGIPLIVGAVLTALDVLLLMGLRGLRLRRLQAITAGVLGLLVAAFVFELLLASPSAAEVRSGLLPSSGLLTDPRQLYLAVAILGATVMPHNLYLHSALVRAGPSADRTERRSTLRRAVLSGLGALAVTAFLNAAIVALSAAAFHRTGHTGVVDLPQAHALLRPLLGSLAAGVFAIALLASAQNATITGTLAGQIVMEGFTRLRLAPWKRRIATRGAALAPTLVVLGLFGEGACGRLLILSQVVLSLQLPFAMIPLVGFTSDRRLMGAHVNSRPMVAVAWSISLLILVADALVLAGTLQR